jgi:hypothetical protein
MFRPKLSNHLVLFVSFDYKNSSVTSLYYSLDLITKPENIRNYDLFFVEPNNKNKFAGFKVFQLFTASYLQNIYKIRLLEKNINAISVLPQKLTKNFLFRVRNINFKQFNIKYFNEVGYLFLVNV